MIRFSCQKCRLKYVLPDALARLPLLCKKCGSRLAVPGPGETVSSPPPPPPPPPTDSEAESPENDSDDDDGLFPPEDEDAPDEFEDEEEPAPDQPGEGDEEPETEEGDDEEPPPDDEEDEPPIHLPDDPPAKVEKPRGVAGVTPPVPATKPSPSPTPLPEGRRALGLVVDIAMGLILIVGGALLGEFAVRKSTAAILREAGTAPKFPPVDLLVWLACVAFPILVMVLFANRGKTVGNWLRRRAG